MTSITVSRGGTVVKQLAKGSRITGPERGTLTAQFAERYAAGESIRSLAAGAGRSYGFVHNLLTEAGASLRGRGGATRGSTKAAVSDDRSATSGSKKAMKSGKKATRKKS